MSVGIYTDYIYMWQQHVSKAAYRPKNLFWNALTEKEIADFVP